MDNGMMTKDEIILWMTHMMVVDGDDYTYIDGVLRTLEHDDLEAINRIASQGYTTAESVRDVLLSEEDTALVVRAAKIVPRFGHQQSVKSIVCMIRKLEELGLGEELLTTHLVADLLCLYIDRSGMTMEESNYMKNDALIMLVQKHPDRMREIMDFRLKRRTNDAELIREALVGSAPLSDGVL